MGCKPTQILNGVINEEIIIKTQKQKKKKHINSPLVVKSTMSNKKIDKMILSYNINEDFYLKVQGPTPLDAINNLKQEVKSMSILLQSPTSQSKPSSQKIQSKKVRFSSILHICYKKKNKQKKKDKVSMETLEEIF